MTANPYDAAPMTPDAHMVETLRLRTAALHRVSRSNDLLRRENDDLRARLARVETLAAWFEAQPNWNEWGIHRQIRAAALDGSHDA